MSMTDNIQEQEEEDAIIFIQRTNTVCDCFFKDLYVYSFYINPIAEQFLNEQCFYNLGVVTTTQTQIHTLQPYDFSLCETIIIPHPIHRKMKMASTNIITSNLIVGTNPNSSILPTTISIHSQPPPLPQSRQHHHFNINSSVLSPRTSFSFTLFTHEISIFQHLQLAFQCTFLQCYLIQYPTIQLQYMLKENTIQIISNALLQSAYKNTIYYKQFCIPPQFQQFIRFKFLNHTIHISFPSVRILSQSSSFSITVKINQNHVLEIIPRYGSMGFLYCDTFSIKVWCNSAWIPNLWHSYHYPLSLCKPTHPEQQEDHGNGNQEWSKQFSKQLLKSIKQKQTKPKLKDIHSISI